MSDKPESVVMHRYAGYRWTYCEPNDVCHPDREHADFVPLAALRKAEEELSKEIHGHNEAALKLAAVTAERDAAIRVVEAAKIMDQEHFSDDEGANDRWLAAVQRFRAALASAPQEKTKEEK